jgi:hypothetical protein
MTTDLLTIDLLTTADSPSATHKKSCPFEAARENP